MSLLHTEGQDASDAIVIKTQDLRIPQSEWSVDKADGTGPSGFKLDITKIQMVYLILITLGMVQVRFVLDLRMQRVMSSICMNSSTTIDWKKHI